MLGRNRLLVLLLACDTLFPLMGRLPVTWHTLDMLLLQNVSQLINLNMLFAWRIAETIKTGCVLYQKMGAYAMRRCNL